MALRSLANNIVPAPASPIYLVVGDNNDLCSNAAIASCGARFLQREAFNRVITLSFLPLQLITDLVLDRISYRDIKENIIRECKDHSKCVYTAVPSSAHTQVSLLAAWNYVRLLKHKRIGAVETMFSLCLDLVRKRYQIITR